MLQIVSDCSVASHGKIVLVSGGLVVHASVFGAPGQTICWFGFVPNERASARSGYSVSVMGMVGLVRKYECGMWTLSMFAI